MNASDLLEERYRLERLLGTGGMSEVWLAEDQRLGRWVAIKLLGGLDAEATAAASREARLVARLQHPNIVTVFDVGMHEGRPFFVMEYVHGYSIRQLLDTQGRFTEPEAIRYGGQIANALNYAHRNGVVHRDLKPENILINENGVAKLADFGVASAITSTLAPGQAEEILGTIAYLPPEVIQGANADARSDIYSLGLTVYEMVAGRLPFNGTTPAAMAGQRLGGTAPPLRSFARSASYELENALARALALNPADRFPTAGDFESALKAVPGQRGPVAPIIAPPGRAPRPLTPRSGAATGARRRNPTTRVGRESLRPAAAPPPPPSTGGMSGSTLAVVIGVLLLALGAGAAFALVLSQQDNGGGDATPTVSPTKAATTAPTQQPTPRPTAEPTLTPTPQPSPSTAATATPTVQPTNTPGARTPTPAASPTQAGPTLTPTTGAPVSPTARP